MKRRQNGGRGSPESKGFLTTVCVKSVAGRKLAEGLADKFRKAIACEQIVTAASAEDRPRAFKCGSDRACGANSARGASDDRHRRQIAAAGGDGAAAIAPASCFARSGGYPGHRQSALRNRRPTRGMANWEIAECQVRRRFDDRREAETPSCSQRSLGELPSRTGLGLSPSDQGVFRSD